MQYKYVARSKNWGRGGGEICPLVEIGLTYLPKCMALNHFFIHCIYAQFSLLSMISRLQPHASSMEAGSIRKPHQNLMSISGKQNFDSEYHYMVFDCF